MLKDSGHTLKQLNVLTLPGNLTEIRLMAASRNLKQ